MNADVKDRWIAALRSGKYPQTTGALHRTKQGAFDEPPGFCCLGVLCDLAVQEGVIEPQGISSSGSVRYGTPLDMSMSLLPMAVCNWAGLLDQAPPISEDGEDGDTLIALNDGGATFEEIADVIEERL